MSEQAAGLRWRAVVAGIGADAHSVGLTVLREGLRRAEFDVAYLGTQRDIETICRHATGAHAVLISNMDGHARYYLEHLALAQRDTGTHHLL